MKELERENQNLRQRRRFSKCQRWTIAKRQRVFAEVAENMPDLVKREFTADRPGRKSVGDIDDRIARDLPTRSSMRETVVCRN